MAHDWRTATLGDLIEIKHGFAFQGQFFRDEPPGDVLLTPGNFAIGGGFKGDKLKYYIGPVPGEFILEENDLLVTMTDLSKAADTLGYPALIPTAKPQAKFLHNQRLGKIGIKLMLRLRKGFSITCFVRASTDTKLLQEQLGPRSNTPLHRAFWHFDFVFPKRTNSTPSPTSSARWTTRST